MNRENNWAHGAQTMLSGLLLALFILHGNAQIQVTTRVSVDSKGIEGNYGGGDQPPSISADGRYVAFSSYSTNLLVGSTWGFGHMFVHDRISGVTSNVSIGMAGQLANSGSAHGDLSADGRFVVFESLASNLVPGDTNGAWDIFLHDRLTGSTECVSIDLFGLPANDNSSSPKISADGHFVCFDSFASNIDPSDSNFSADIFIYNRLSRTVERISLDTYGGAGNQSSRFPDISSDGRFVAFKSWATNLVPGDTNGIPDYFVRDRQLWKTERVSVDSNGNQRNDSSPYAEDSDPGISGDGRYVVFSSNSTNLVPGDTNSRPDVFIRDRQLGNTERVNVNSEEEEADKTNGFSTLILPEVSDDGRYVVFNSRSTNMVPFNATGIPSVYVRDRVKGVTELVEVSSDGVLGNWIGSLASITPDGRFIAYISASDNLVPGDTNHWSDTFVRDRMTGGPDVDLTNVLAGQTATLSITGATPGGIVVLGASLLGQGILPTAWGPLELNGVSVFFAYVMDGAGQVSVPVWLDPALLGLPLWVQGIDLTMDFPTSVWGGTIQ